MERRVALLVLRVYLSFFVLRVDPSGSRLEQQLGNRLLAALRRVVDRQHAFFVLGERLLVRVLFFKQLKFKELLLQHSMQHLDAIVLRSALTRLVDRQHAVRGFFAESLSVGFDQRLS